MYEIRKAFSSKVIDNVDLKEDYHSMSWLKHKQVSK